MHYIRGQKVNVRALYCIHIFILLKYALFSHMGLATLLQMLAQKLELQVIQSLLSCVCLRYMIK